MAKKKPLYERFNSRYKVVESGCWEWQGGLTTKGYGAFSIDGYISISAHRLSYILFIGEIPNGLHVLHKCDNRKCVNPFHLFAGTQLDNNLDCIKKGRRKRIINNCL